MSHRFNISNINNDFEEEYDQPDNLDLEGCIDFDEYENDVDCFACFGTGEGHASDTTCSFCNGLGTIRKRKF